MELILLKRDHVESITKLPQVRATTCLDDWGQNQLLSTLPCIRSWTPLLIGGDDQIPAPGMYKQGFNKRGDKPE